MPRLIIDLPDDQEFEKEVQNAYETIMKERQNGSYGRTGYNSGYSNSGYSGSSYSNSGSYGSYDSGRQQSAPAPSAFAELDDGDGEPPF